MIAPASAGATCVRTKSLRYLVCVPIRLPFVFSCLPLLDFAGTTVNAVTINSRAYFGIAAPFDVMDFAENEFKISVGCLLGTVRDTIR
jgi:hypothetical protein